jgi:single-stranded-DNA-specific exonuclease
MSGDVEREWRVREVDSDAVESLTATLDSPRIVAELLAHRDVRDPEDALAFLEPSLENLSDPTLLPDVEQAVERVDRAISDEERILLYADRDVDGCCGCAILVRLFELLGADVDWYVPGKWDGYGLHESAIEDHSAAIDLLVTVDCGTTAHDQIAVANDHGIDVVVTDHHDPDEGLPPSFACFNPRREESACPHESVAGGAVAMKLG